MIFIILHPYWSAKLDVNHKWVTRSIIDVAGHDVALNDIVMQVAWHQQLIDVE